MRDVELLPSGGGYLVGFDEAGRGAVAGPLVVGVVAATGQQLAALTSVQDSKTLSAARRQELFDVISTSAAYGVGFVDAATVDVGGISRALRLASARAWGALVSAFPSVSASVAVVDGPYNWSDPLAAPGAQLHCVVKADATYAVVAAASIAAKVSRDAYMCRAHNDRPVYGWSGNKGYGTKAHYEAISKHGFCNEHRTSWKMPPWVRTA